MYFYKPIVFIMATGVFDEQSVVLRFPVISDIHIMGKGKITSQKLESAYQQLNAMGQYDALVVAGDMTDYGLVEQIGEFRDITEKYINLHTTRLIFSLGNHEYYNHELNGAPFRGGFEFTDVFGRDVLYQGASEEEIAAANYHTVVKGYHFIAVDCTQYSGGVNFSEDNQHWLWQQLDKAVQDAPERPIFVLSHPMICGTNYGSDYGDYWAGSCLYDILKQYPQVIYFAGHLHFPLNVETSIWQKEFTTVGTSSVYFSSLENKDAQGIPYYDIAADSEVADCKEFSQGLFAEIDCNHNVRLTRLDFHNHAQIKQPWIIPAPKKDNSHLQSYTLQARTQHKMSPYFPVGSKVSLPKIELDSSFPKYEITFSVAKDEDMVFSYLISFVDAETEQEITSVLTYSDFYKYPNLNQMPNTLTKSFSPSKLLPFYPYYSRDYYIQITAIDSYGNKSYSLFGQIIDGTTEVFQDKHLNVSTNVTKKVFENFKSFSDNTFLTDGKEYFCWPPVDSGNSAMPLVIHTQDASFNIVDATLQSGCYQFYVFPKREYSSDAINFQGYDQCWIWVDFSDVEVKRLFFSFQDELFGTEFSTDDINGYDMIAYIQQDEQWKKVLFSQDGCLEILSGYKGYIRFSTQYFYNMQQNKFLPLERVSIFKLCFISNQEEIKGKHFSVGEIFFTKNPD